MATDRLPTPNMVMAGEQYQRQLLAQEVAERAKDPLNVAKRPGGFYLRADGTPVDANDKEIADSLLSADEKKAVKAHKGILDDEEKEQTAAEKEAAKAQAAADKTAAEARKAADEAREREADAQRHQAMADEAKAKRGRK
jgi:hypothetical protein